MSNAIKKVLDDSQIITIKNNYSEDLDDMMQTRNAVVAVCQEIDDLYTITAAAADFPAFKAALGARGPLKYIQFTY
jgi:hypothetical protein